MTRIRIAKTIVVLAALASAGGGTAASAAPADPGGAAATGGGASGPPAAGASPAPPAVSGIPAATPIAPVVVTSGAVALRVRASTLLGQTLDFHGRVSRREAGRTVLIQHFDDGHGAWLPAASTLVDRHGAFLAGWRSNLVGRIPMRAVVGGRASVARRGTGGSAPQSSSAAQITIYRPAVATYFGPGFFGETTACGQRLTPSVVGVAHRTLPCGTLVEVTCNGRKLTVPVVDRGPYANGADWDLTSGAASAMGISGTVHIGTIVVGRVPSTPPLGAPAGTDSAGAVSGAATAAPTGGASAGG